MDMLLRLLSVLAGIFGVGMSLWGGYYLLTGLASWRKTGRYIRQPACTRFAVMIAARNEELVIGGLINSLLMQDYPRELYDIYVIPNNCTDNTAQAAERFGARVLECTVPVHSKGEVLRLAWSALAGRGYDAVCVFDADNIVDCHFLAEMNNAYCGGARAAQGYRDSKNPYDTAVSAGCSIYYWMMDRFYNGGKSALGLSALIGGTGFMVSASVLDKLGGWHTKTISEDLEITVQCALAGVQVVWVPAAVTYDEQPLTFEQSLTQRRRWSSGTLQVASGYLPLLFRALVEEGRPVLGDLCAALVIPAYQAALLLNTLAQALCKGLSGRPFTFLWGAFLGSLAVNLAITVLSATLSAVLVLTVEGKWDRRMLKGLGFYWLFLLSWLPITLESFVNPTTDWKEIRHTRGIRPQARKKTMPVRQ